MTIDVAEQARVADAVTQPSYTPGRRDLPVVVALIAGDDERLATLAIRALRRATPAAARAALAAALPDADDAGAVRLVAALGQLARGAEGEVAGAALIELLAEDRARIRRAAIQALGKVGGELARDALRRHAARADLPVEERRALVEALGKVGGPDAAAAIAGLGGREDDETRRRADRALLMTERDALREVESRIRDDVRLPDSATVACRCRNGLEALLAEELAGLGRARTERGVVRVAGGVPFAAFFVARTWLTIAIERPLAPGDGLAARIAATLAEPETRGLLAALTDGPIRWRLDFERGGHRRGAVWEAAQAVRGAAPELVNDPTRSTWEVVVDEDAGMLELRPRSLPDPRFAWRVADVSAASHPTIAAAIARVAGGGPDDVVWDPFCGSGSELVERGRLGAARLCGSDLDARALAAARANLEAAGLTAELTLADALAHDPGGVTAIVTNPPLGRRLRGDPGALLERFVVHAARALRPGGRLVWITPVATRTERAARRAGLRLDDRRSVDLGGYDADLERWLR